MQGTTGDCSCNVVPGEAHLPSCDAQANLGQLIDQIAGTGCSAPGLGVSLDGILNITYDTAVARHTNNTIYIGDLLSALMATGRSAVLVPGTARPTTVPAGGVVDFDFDPTTVTLQGRLEIAAVMIKYSTNSQNGIGSCSVTTPSPGAAAVWIDGRATALNQPELPQWLIETSKGSSKGLGMLVSAYMNPQSVYCRTTYIASSGLERGLAPTANILRYRATAVQFDTVAIYPFALQLAECQAAIAALSAAVMVAGTPAVALNQLGVLSRTPEYRKALKRCAEYSKTAGV